MSAIISECGLYRVRLERDLGRAGPAVAILGVNPSTADATANDATIRKDIGFGAAKDGQPRHTLMLPYDTPLIDWVRNG